MLLFLIVPTYAGAKRTTPCRSFDNSSSKEAAVVNAPPREKPIKITLWPILLAISIASSDGLNTSTYKFVKGNPITAYKITLNPGFQLADAIPGTQFNTTNNATAKILDVFKPTNDTHLTIKDDWVSGDLINLSECFFIILIIF